MTYLISYTVFLVPYALQIANSHLDLKNLEGTVKFGVYSPTSLTGPRTTGAPAKGYMCHVRCPHLPPVPTKEPTSPLPH